MMADLKRGFRLIRYGHGLVLNMVVAVLFLLIGILFLFVGPEGMLMSTLYILMAPLMFMQMEYSLLYAGTVLASPRHRMLEIHMADVFTVISGVIGCAVILGAGAYWCTKEPEEAEYCMKVMLASGAMVLFMLVYLGVAYKYFFMSMVAFMVGILVGGNGEVFVLELSGIPYTFTNVALISLACIILGVVLSYIIRRLLYRKPISKWSAGASLRKSLQ